MKWLTVIGCVVFLLFLGVALLLTIFFPSDLVRMELEARLSEMLQGTVQIETLAFNLVTGLGLKNVTFSKESQRLLAVHELILDYSFLELLQQRLKINEIRLDGADIALDLPALRASMANPEPQSGPEPKASEIPVTTLAVDLESLVLRGVNLSMVVAQDLALTLRDLNVEVSAGLDGPEANIEGSVRVAEVVVERANKHLRFPFEVGLRLLADLSAQVLQVKVLTIASQPAFTLTVSGDVTNIFGDPSVDLVMKKVQIDLAQVHGLVEDFIPSDFRDMVVSGQLEPGLMVKGTLTTSGFQGLADGDLVLKRMALRLPQLDVTLSPTDVTLHLLDLTVNGNRPESATLNLLVKADQVTYQNYAVRDVNVHVAGDYFALGPVSTQMTLTGVSALPAMGEFAPMTIPVSLEMKAVGNHRVQELTVKQFDFKLGQWMNMEVQGFVRPQTDAPFPLQLEVTARVEPHIDQIVTLLPKKLLSGLTIQKYTTPDTILVKATGMLDDGYVPQEAQGTMQVHLSAIDFTQKSPPVDGQLKDLQLSLSTGYHSLKQTVSGTISGTVTLANLAYDGMLRLGGLGITLGSSFAGALSPSYGMDDMRVRDTLTMALRNVHVVTPTFRAGLDSVTLSAKTHEDLVRQIFSLDDFRVSSDSLFQMKAGGHYRQDTQAFQAQVEIPTMNVGGLLQHVSGEAVESFQGIQPSGEVEISVTASGRVPQKGDIEHLNFPLKINSQVLARSVSGVFAQHRVNNATAKVVFDFSPGALPLAEMTTGLTVDDIQLAPGFPLSALSHSALNLDLTMRGFDEMNIRSMSLATQGGRVSVKGYVAGLREFLASTPQKTAAVGKLFANLDAQAQVALGEFQQILSHAGVQGSGQAELGVSFFKKEQGPINVKVLAGGTGVGISRDGVRVENVNGRLDVRKRLNWAEHMPLPSRVFNPTDVLAQLRAIDQEGQRVSIDLLDLGFVTIRNFSTYVGFDRNALKIQNLAMNVLGGGLGGNVVVTTGKAFGLSGRFELAQLDLNNLLEERLKIAGDSLVDATIGMSVFFEETTGALDLSRTELNVFMTHIGSKALDRILVFLDPDGSNPTLVNARSQIKLANPSRVTIQLERGMMNLEILFSEGLVPPFRMNRIPVGKLKNFQAVTETIPHWTTIKDLMLLLGAETYGVDQQGQWVMK